MNKMRGWNCIELGRPKRKRKRGEVETSRRCINKNPFRPKRNKGGSATRVDKKGPRTEAQN